MATVTIALCGACCASALYCAWLQWVVLCMSHQLTMRPRPHLYKPCAGGRGMSCAWAGSQHQLTHGRFMPRATGSVYASLFCPFANLYAI